MDIVLYGSRYTDAGKYEGLVVELKAPAVALSTDVLSQIERYANIIRKEPQFSGNSRTWKFIAVCSKIDDDVSSRFQGYEPHGKPGLAGMIGNFEIYAYTWDDIFLNFERRYSFIMEKMKESIADISPELLPGDETGRQIVDARVKALLNLSAGKIQEDNQERL